MSVIFFVLQNLLLCFNNVIDNLMVGRLGEEFTAGISAANSFFDVLKFVIVGASAAATILIAKNSKDDGEKAKIISTGAIMNMALAIFSLYLYFTGRDLILGIFTKDATIKGLGISYLNIVIWSIITFGIKIILLNFTRAIGKVKLSFFITLINFVLNLALNILFISILGFGFVGSAIATVTTDIIIVALSAISIRKDLAKVLAMPKLSLESAYKYLLFSIPLALSSLGSNLSGFLRLSFFSRLGEDALTSFGIVATFSAIIFSVFEGIANASTVTLGSVKRDEIYKESKKYIYITLITAAAFFVVTLLFGRHIISLLFKLDSESLRDTTTIFRLTAFTNVNIAIYSILSYGILAFGGDVLFILFTNTFTDWLIMLPVTFYAVSLTTNNVYVLLASEISNIVYSAILVYRFVSKKWMKK